MNRPHPEAAIASEERARALHIVRAYSAWAETMMRECRAAGHPTLAGAMQERMTAANRLTQLIENPASSEITNTL